MRGRQVHAILIWRLARAKRDASDKADIKRVLDASRGRNGARKVWHAFRREGKDIARRTPLMVCRANHCRAMERLHSAIRYLTPQEAEEAFYENLNAHDKAAQVSNKALSGKPGAVHP